MSDIDDVLAMLKNITESEKGEASMALKRFALTVRESLDEKEWSQKFLADKAKMKASQISRILNARQDNIELTTMVKLLWALGKRLDFVTEDKEYKEGKEDKKERRWQSTERTSVTSEVSTEASFDFSEIGGMYAVESLTEQPTTEFVAKSKVVMINPKEEVST